MIIDRKTSETLKKMNLICTIIIIFGHSYNLTNFSTENEIVYFFEWFISYCIGGIGVPFFFIQSAFFLYLKERKALEVYKSRLKSLVVPYLAWNLIYMICYTLLGVISFDIQSVFKAVFLFNSNTTFWFMYQLIIFTALYPLIAFCRKKPQIFYGIYILLLFLYLWKGEFLGWTGAMSITISVRRLLEYLFGIIVADNIQKFPAVFKKIKKNVLNFIIILMLAGCTIIYILHALYRNAAMEQLLLFVNIVFLFLMFIGLYNRNKYSADNVIFKVTFLIYAMHPIIMISFRKIAAAILPSSVAWIFTCYLVFPIICIGIVLGFIYGIKNMCPKLLCVLNGFRTIE